MYACVNVLCMHPARRGTGTPRHPTPPCDMAGGVGHLRGVRSVYIPSPIFLSILQTPFIPLLPLMSILRVLFCLK